MMPAAVGVYEASADRPLSWGSRALPITGFGLHRGLFLLYFFGVYSEFHLYSGSSILFPFVVSHLAGVASILLAWRRFSSLLTSMIVAIAVVDIVSLPPLLVLAEDAAFVEQIRSLIQLNVSMVSGCGAFISLLSLGREFARRMFFTIATFILVVSVFEVYLGGHDVMVAINNVLYSWRPLGAYVDNGRDIALWGAVRPLVFSTEPSLVGIWSSTCLGLYLILSERTWRNFAVYGGMVLATLIVCRSPTSGVIAYATVIFLAINSRNAALYLSGLLVLPVLLYVTLAYSPFYMRAVSYAEQASFFARLIAPYLFTLDVFANWPFFGIGVGAVDLFRGDVLAVWSKAGIFSSQPFAATWVTGDLLTNSFFWHWIYFGAVGGLVVLLSLTRAIRAAGVRNWWLVIAPTAICWQTVGGYVDARTWIFFFLYMAAAVLVQPTAGGVAAEPATRLASAQNMPRR